MTLKPTRLLLGLFALVVIAAAVFPDTSAWAAILGTVAALLVVDALLVQRIEHPRVIREVASSLPVNREAAVSIQLHNAGRRVVTGEYYERLPQRCAVRALPVQFRLAPGEVLSSAYFVTPTERGDLALGPGVAELRSPFGLWLLQRRVDVAAHVHVYPDFAAITRYLDLVHDQQSRRIGLKLAPRRGEGLEFHQLREYRESDSVRQIDWKATSRYRTLISREYQEERDQRLVFLVDSGGRMRARDGALSHFDHALNAVLLLAYVALRQGDTVSLRLFGPAEKWVPDVRGTQGVKRLLAALYDQHPGVAAGDFVTAAEAVMRTERKRALVVLVTNLREEDADLAPALKLLRKRHMVMLANLRETATEDALRDAVQSPDGALQFLGAYRYSRMRDALRARLAQSTGVLIDCVPSELPLEIINGYWHLKRSGAL